MEIIYTAVATSVGGRSGNVKSSDGALNLEVRPPVQIGDADEGKYTNPEQLFAAGYAACFNSALAHVALSRKMRISPTVTAKVSMGRRDDGKGYQLAVEIDVYVPDVEQKLAEELAHEAHELCPYSNATRNNIDVKIKVTSGNM